MNPSFIGLNVFVLPVNITSIYCCVALSDVFRSVCSYRCIAVPYIRHQNDKNTTQNDKRKNTKQPEIDAKQLQGHGTTKNNIKQADFHHYRRRVDSHRLISIVVKDPALCDVFML